MSDRIFDYMVRVETMPEHIFTACRAICGPQEEGTWTYWSTEKTDSSLHEEISEWMCANGLPWDDEILILW